MDTLGSLFEQAYDLNAGEVESLQGCRVLFPGGAGKRTIGAPFLTPSWDELFPLQSSASVRFRNIPTIGGILDPPIHVISTATVEWCGFTRFPQPSIQTNEGIAYFYQRCLEKLSQE